MLAAKHNFLLLSVAAEERKMGAYIHIYIFLFTDYEYIPHPPLHFNDCARPLTSLVEGALEYFVKSQLNCSAINAK